MKERIKKCFETPKKMAVSIACIVAILIILGAGSAYAATSVAKSSAIGEENAKNFAFADAGVDPAAAGNVVVDFEFEGGQFVYDVEFDANGSEYEYWIKASDGTVVKKDVEIVNLESASTAAAEAAALTEDEAKEIALADAGVTASDVTYTKVAFDYDDGMSLYDIEFYTADAEYEYEINADTGAIYSKSKETLVQNAASSNTASSSGGATDSSTSGDTGSSSNTNSSSSGNASSNATANSSNSGEAGNANSSNAQSGTTGTSTSNSGTSGTNSNNGNAAANSGTSSSYISVDEAKSIALGKAGLSASQVSFTKTKLENDDGIMEYEIEFYQGRTEYEVTINATTGAIIDYDVDYDD